MDKYLKKSEKGSNFIKQEEAMIRKENVEDELTEAISYCDDSEVNLNNDNEHQQRIRNDSEIEIQINNELKAMKGPRSFTDLENDPNFEIEDAATPEHDVQVRSSQESHEYPTPDKLQRGGKRSQPPELLRSPKRIKSSSLPSSTAETRWPDCDDIENQLRLFDLDLKYGPCIGITRVSD